MVYLFFRVSLFEQEKSICVKGFRDYSRIVHIYIFVFLAVESVVVVV